MKPMESIDLEPHRPKHGWLGSWVLNSLGKSYVLISGRVGSLVSTSVPILLPSRINMEPEKPPKKQQNNCRFFWARCQAAGE